MFPEFSLGNCINSQGVKSLGAALDYLIKEINPGEVLEFINRGELKEECRFYTNVTPKEFITLSKKTQFHECIEVIRSMMKYCDIEDWIGSTMKRVTLYTRRKAIINSLWELSRQFIKREDKFEELIATIGDVSYSDFEEV